MAKKLVTVTWSVGIEVELPDNITVESFNDLMGPNAQLEFNLVKEASDNLSWKMGNITSIDEIPDDN